MRSLALGLALGALTGILFSSTAGAQWVPNGRPVSSSEGTHSKPTVVPDGSGGAYVVWQYGGPGPQEVYVSHVLADGTAGTGFLPLGSPVSDATGPRFVRGAGQDGSGGLVVGWASTAWGSSDSVWAKRMHSNGTPADGWLARGNAHSTYGVYEAGEVVADGLGGAWFRSQIESAFCPHPPPCERYTSDQWARHIDAGGAWNSAAFNFVSVTDPDSPGRSSGSLIEFSSPGTAFMHGGFGSLRRVNAPYQTTWSSGALNNWWQYRVWSDGAGGALVLADVAYVRRLGADGQMHPEWPSGGVQLSPFATTVDAVTAEPASLLIGWMESVVGGTELRVQKLSGAGVPATGWPAGGVVVSSAPGFYGPLVMAPDGVGGALIVWREVRDDPEGDLYAHHVLANGDLDPVFLATGTPIAAVPGGVTYPSLSRVSPDAAIVAWTDHRTLSEIRAQRISFQAINDVGPPGMGRTSLAGFAPNPAFAGPRVAFTLTEAGDASVELFDLAGRRVHAARFGGLPAGPHALALAPATPLPPGLYLVRLRALGEERVGRGLIAR